MLTELILPKELITEDVEAFADKAIQIIKLYAKKNKDYGNAFRHSFEKRGPVAMLSRLDEKLYRLDTITKNGETAVDDESAIDSLLDIAAYAIMGAVEFTRGLGVTENKDND